MKLQFGQHEPGADGPAAEAAAADASLDSATLALPAEPINGGGRALVERAVLVTADADVPSALRSVPAAGGGTAAVYRATYAANDPNEDRHTVVIGEDFLFAGVWDGHGGCECSDYTERHVYQHFKAAMQKGLPCEAAFAHAYRATDIHYLQQAKDKVESSTSGGRPTDLFAGSCAVSVFVDLEARKICVGNLGDCRVVLGVSQGGALRTVQLSDDHSADLENERLRVMEEHPGDREALINCGGDYGEPDDWRVKGVCAFTRSLGDFQMKEKTAATLYNTYTQGYKVRPVPGVNGAGHAATRPYIINEPTYVEHDVPGDCVLIVACDGVWDEMSSEEAVEVVHEVSAGAGSYGGHLSEIADACGRSLRNTPASPTRRSPCCSSRRCSSVLSSG